MYKDKDFKLIAVSNRHLCAQPLLKQIEWICSADLEIRPDMLILREKDMMESDYLVLAKETLEICRAHQVQCVLHSFPAVAAELGVPYLHLPLNQLRAFSARDQQRALSGKDRQRALSAREQLGAFSGKPPLPGTSVHSLEEALEAQTLGVSYLTAGHIYVTDCKKGLAPRGLDFLRAICAAADVPVYAIGGIGLDEKQLMEVRGCGASGACIMSGYMRY